jgi:hypothetical protein
MASTSRDNGTKMVLHKWIRVYLAIFLECNEIVLNALFVAWPLQQMNKENGLVIWSLDGENHCLWGPSHVTTICACYSQQGVLHRIDGPALDGMLVKRWSIQGKAKNKA